MLLIKLNWGRNTDGELSASNNETLLNSHTPAQQQSIPSLLQCNPVMADHVSLSQIKHIIVTDVAPSTVDQYLHMTKRE